MACELKNYGGCDLFKQEVKQSLKNLNINNSKEGNIPDDSAEIPKIIGILTLLWESDEKSNREFVQKQLIAHKELMPFFNHIFNQTS